MTTGIEPGTPAAPRPPEAQAAKPSSFARIAGVLFSPGETFRSIARQPDWVVPFLLILLMAIAGTVIVAARVDFVAPIRAQIQEQNPNMPQEQVE